jgi:hypothetical protein
MRWIYGNDGVDSDENGLAKKRRTMITSNDTYMHEDIEGPSPVSSATQRPDRLLIGRKLVCATASSIDNHACKGSETRWYGDRQY